MKDKIFNERNYIVSILIIIGMSFGFSNSYVSGESEIRWAITGVVHTNYTLLMFVLFAIAGGGTAFMVYKYAKRLRLPISIMTAVMTALVMTMSEIFFWIMPIIVILIFASLKLGIVEKMKKRRIK